MSLKGSATGQTLVGSIQKCDMLMISAYGIAVKNGFQGTEEEWLESLKGDPGDVSAELDTTLTQRGKAADAKSVGDKIAEITGVSLLEPAEDDIPKFFYGGDLPQTKDDAIMPFRYISKTQDISGYCKTKAQGTSSMNFPKKNQTTKFYKDSDCTEKMKVDFKGWGGQNKFCFKANWIDISHARNIVSARLWGDVVKSRASYAELPELLRTSPNHGAIDGFPVKVYANGVYQGRYTLNIPKDGWMANMDKDNEAHCILCGENYGSGCFRAEAKIDESDWSDELHETVPESIKTRWNEVISFVMNSTDDNFRANLGNYFDVPSLIDYHLYGLASCGLDGYGKNQLYVTYDGQKWFASMYDMDSTWGLYYTGGKILSADYGRTDYEDFVNGRQGNLLYIRLEQLFGKELQTRWAELKAGALSIENIINRFERFTDIAPAELVKEDYASTTASGKFTGIPSNSTNNIQQIRSFALARQAWTDEYVAMLTPADPVPCTGITLSANTLTFTAEGTQTLTAITTPEGCTDAVTWETTDETIATVKNGVVTAVANGNVTITAKCGGHSATCSVTISGIEMWEEPEMPTDGLLYSVSNKALNGTEAIDTGVKLLESTSAFTIVLAVKPDVQSINNATLLHCMEETSPYNGLSVRVISTNTCYDICTGGNRGTKFTELSKDTTDRFRIVMTYNSAVGMSIYVKNSAGLFAHIVDECAFGDVSKSLVIGGYQDSQGTKGRFWAGTIDSCKVYNQVIDAEHIAAFIGAELSAPSVNWSDAANSGYDTSGNKTTGSNYCTEEPVAVPPNVLVTLENAEGASYTFLRMIEYDASMALVAMSAEKNTVVPRRIITNENTAFVNLSAYPNGSANNDPTNQLKLWWLS